MAAMTTIMPAASQMNSRQPNLRIAVSRVTGIALRALNDTAHSCAGTSLTWARPPPMPVWDTLPQQIPPLLRRLPGWRLLRIIRLDDETALSLGWQRNPRLINRSGDQRFHVGMCQL